MKLTYLLLAGVLLAANTLATPSDAENIETEHGRVKVLWQDPQSYRDVKVASGIQSRFELRTFETLTKNLDRQANKTLQGDQQLEMTVTDLDLAGDVRPTFGASINDIRLIENIYPPRISFSYQVLQGGQVMLSGKEKLTDMGFMYAIGRTNDKPLKYETKLLNDWMKQSLAPKL